MSSLQPEKSPPAGHWKQCSSVLRASELQKFRTFWLLRFFKTHLRFFLVVKVQVNTFICDIKQ